MGGTGNPSIPGVRERSHERTASVRLGVCRYGAHLPAVANKVLTNFSFGYYQENSLISCPDVTKISLLCE